MVSIVSLFALCKYWFGSSAVLNSYGIYGHSSTNGGLSFLVASSMYCSTFITSSFLFSTWDFLIKHGIPEIMADSLSGPLPLAEYLWTISTCFFPLLLSFPFVLLF